MPENKPMSKRPFFKMRRPSQEELDRWSDDYAKNCWPALVAWCNQDKPKEAK